ncbi:NAD(P)/FAD-dependent oxidoreductase [Mycobacterium sp. GA-2829]|uniref:FAD-dependent oxidoreductase n=1 Tax=Mycobacterium sp. GA-2829 TaxID=1772283 RepID=UPI00073FF486|nr:FAD-dependent oxidoreductase [Mycobacterium sp. GA-2829]KUI35047.1 FAD-dependent oxidoreductase [Mycobacterium sp. GA-2829]
MRIIVVGAGPAGLFCAVALARRGHRVAVVDRDPGPPASGRWRRRGVMQFDHAHTFRAPVVAALRDEIPGAVEALAAVGARIVPGPGGALLCRRSTFERELHRIAAGQHGLTRYVGTVDRPEFVGGRVAGVVVDGRVFAADLVIDASGRAARYLRGLRPEPVGADCGAVYATRQYRTHTGATAGPVNSPIGLSLSMSGYAAIAFVHDAGTFSITLVHDGTDLRLRRLRDDAVFEAAVGAIPQLCEWIDPRHAHPLTAVLTGGRVYNSYGAQLAGDGGPCLPGLISVGDAVCTTTPLAGRGVTLAFRQAAALLRILDDENESDSAAVRFAGWCDQHVRPWFADHLDVDGDRMRRWAGGAVDLTRPLPSDLVVAAAGADASLGPLIEPYAAMTAPPAGLAPARRRAHEIFAAGWRPPVPPGPDRYELAAICERPTAAVSSTPAAV